MIYTCEREREREREIHVSMDTMTHTYWNLSSKIAPSVSLLPHVGSCKQYPAWCCCSCCCCCCCCQMRRTILLAAKGESRGREERVRDRSYLGRVCVSFSLSLFWLEGEPGLQEQEEQGMEKLSAKTWTEILSELFRWEKEMPGFPPPPPSLTHTVTHTENASRWVSGP